MLIAEAVNFGDEILLKEMMYNIQEEQKMLTGFMGKLAK